MLYVRSKTRKCVLMIRINAFAILNQQTSKECYMHDTNNSICHILTAKIWAVTEWRGDDAIGHDDVDDALLDEEHTITESTFLYDIVGGLEDLEFEQRHHTGDEVWVGTDEERDGCDQVATIVVCDILRMRMRRNL